MSVEPGGAPAEEPLEEFYGDDRDALARLEGGHRDGSGGGGVPGGGGSGAIRRTPVAGALMAGIALGLRKVFEPVFRDRMVIEQPAPEQPSEPQRYEIHLDRDAPESSFAVYRPWVGDDRDREASEGEVDDGEARPGPDRGDPAAGPGALGA